MSDMNPDEVDRLWWGDLRAALARFEQVFLEEGLDRATGEISLEAARAFAEELIFDPYAESARLRMRQDPKGAAAFYELAHEVGDLFAESLPPKLTRSDGKHEPFLLVATAVLNWLDRPET